MGRFQQPRNAPAIKVVAEKRMPVTLNDIAQVAGVHAMTVSNALNGTGRVAAETRERICRIAQELDYRPNVAARALATGRTGTIAIALGVVNEHYYAQLLHLLEMELASHNYKMLFLRSSDLEQDLLAALKSSSVDGVIAIDVIQALGGLLQNPNITPPPCVYATVFDPELVAALPIDNIAIDLTGAVEEAVRVMLANGCRRLGYIVSDAVLAQESEVRSRAFHATVKAAGHTPEIINLDIGASTANRALARHRVTEYIEAHGCPDGLLCQNDELAIATYRALLDQKLRVPDDVLLVGCDGIPYMEFFETPLSTIKQPAQEMCALAWQFLQQRIADPTRPIQKATLSAQLIQRRSLQR
jgi:DNA-binding LacI/PurR family transcriptional regulator